MSYSHLLKMYTPQRVHVSEKYHERIKAAVTRDRPLAVKLDLTTDGEDVVLLTPGQIIKIYGEVEKVGKTSLTQNMEARRHSVYNGTQRNVVCTQMTFVRIDGDGEAIPISEKVRQKYRSKEDFS